MSPLLRKLLLPFALTATLAASPHDFEVDGIYYKINRREANTVWVTYSGRTPDAVADEYAGHVDIPECVENDGVKYTVTQIGAYAFKKCGGLHSVTLPSSITVIDSDAFYECVSLNDLVLPHSVTTIGTSAFFHCESLTLIEIPESVVKIDIYAFRNCHNLASVTLPSQIETLSLSIFQNCRALKSIIIPASVKTIDGSAFSGCENLTDINIPEAVETIGSKAFAGCASLKHLALPESVTSIGRAAFEQCENLTTINIPDAVTLIDPNTFDGCIRLASIVIPANVTEIRTSAFQNCSALTAIDLPKSLEKIEIYAFQGCTSLKRINCHSDNPPQCDIHALYGLDSDHCILYVPDGSRSVYATADEWKNFSIIREYSQTLVSTIGLSVNSAELIVGSTLQLSATILPANATNQALVWESSDVSVADVNGEGLVTGLKEGTATITARSADGNAEATCVLTVKDMSGIDTVNAPSAYTLVKTPNGYIVKNACGTQVEVYSADGRIVYLAPSYAEEEIALPAGLYIVRAANRAWKVRF